MKSTQQIMLTVSGPGQVTLCAGCCGSSAIQRREALRATKSARKHLRLAADEHCPPAPVAKALEIVMSWLEGEADRLAAGSDAAPAPIAKAVPTFRVVR